MSDKPKLAAVLAFIDDPPQWDRFVTEMETPGPWKHEWDIDPPVYVGGHLQNWVCLKCQKTKRLVRREDLPQDECTVPDPLTKSLAEIIDAHSRWNPKFAWWKFYYAARQVYTAYRQNHLEGNYGDTDKDMAEWYILAGAKLQYVTLLLAEGRMEA